MVLVQRNAQRCGHGDQEAAGRVVCGGFAGGEPVAVAQLLTAIRVKRTKEAIARGLRELRCGAPLGLIVIRSFAVMYTCEPSRRTLRGTGLQSLSRSLLSLNGSGDATIGRICGEPLPAGPESWAAMQRVSQGTTSV
jgi:hypothetical protein